MLVDHEIKDLIEDQNIYADEEIKASLMSVCAIVHPASMIKKNILMINSIRYEAYFSPAEDYRLWCRLIPYTKFHNLPDVLFKYRDHGTNTSGIRENRNVVAQSPFQEL